MPCDIKNDEKITLCPDKIENHLHKMLSATSLSNCSHLKLNRKKELPYLGTNILCITMSISDYMTSGSPFYVSAVLYHKLIEEVYFNYFIPEVLGLMMIANNLFSTIRSREKNFSESDSTYNMY